MWRVPAAGFFEETRTAPAQPVADAMAETERLLSSTSD
jgi:hypothetical protein